MAIVRNLYLYFKVKFIVVIIKTIQFSGVLRNRHTGVPPQGFRCAANFYKTLHIRTLQL